MDVALIEEEDQTAQTQNEWIAALEEARAALAAPAALMADCSVCGQEFPHYHRDTPDGEEIVRPPAGPPLDVERLPESASIAEFRRRVREAIHPTSGMCGKNSTGCRTRHSLATIDCLNLLGRGEFALARLLLHEYDSARLAAAYDAEGES